MSKVKVAVTTISEWNNSVLPELNSEGYSCVIAKKVNKYGSKDSGPISFEVHHNGQHYYGLLLFSVDVAYLKVSNPVNLLRLFTDHSKVTSLTLDVFDELIKYISYGTDINEHS